MRCVTKPTTVRAGIKKVCHVNGAVIKANKKTGRNDPVITVQSSDGNIYGRRVEFPDGAAISQHFDHPRSNGAVVTIVTTGTVTVFP